MNNLNVKSDSDADQKSMKSDYSQSPILDEPAEECD